MKVSSDGPLKIIFYQNAKNSHFIQNLQRKKVPKSCAARYQSSQELTLQLKVFILCRKRQSHLKKFYLNMLYYNEDFSLTEVSFGQPKEDKSPEVLE